MGIKTRWEAAKATIFGISKEPFIIKDTKTLVLGAVEQSYGIYQIPSFRDEVTTFWNDPLLKEAVTMFSEQVVATGVYLTANPDYTKKIGDKAAIDIIKEWCDENNIDIKLVEMCIELKAFGNSFWRLDKDLGFAKIPIEAVWHMVRVDPKIPLQEKYHIQLVPIYGAIVIPWGEFIHFRIGVTGYHAPFGQGVMYGLLAKPIDSYGRVCPSIYDIRLSMRASLDEGFRKFSFGNVWIGVPSLSNEDFKASGLADSVSKMGSTGNRVVTNSDVKVQLEVPERTESYDKFIQYMRDEFMMSLADPSLKLGLEQGFTKATSVTAREVYRYKVTTMRNTIKQHLEDLFKQILDKLGYDGMEAGIKLNFGPEEMAEYNIADIFAAVDRDIIGKDEARHLLSTYQKWDITGKAPKVEPEIDPKTGLPIKKQSMKVPLAPQQTQQKMATVFGESVIIPEVANKMIPQAPQTIVETVELPEGIAGYNADFSKIYIDMSVQPKAIELGLDGDKVQQVIVAHETFEYQALRAGRSWNEAHHLATLYEKTISKNIGLDWETYDKMYKSLLPVIKTRGSIGPSDICHEGREIKGDK